MGRVIPHHQIAHHLTPSTYALFRALSVAPCGLILRMYLCTSIDLACNVGSDQWAISVLFDCLFNRVAWLPLNTFGCHISL